MNFWWVDARQSDQDQNRAPVFFFFFSKERKRRKIKIIKKIITDVSIFSFHSPFPLLRNTKAQCSAVEQNVEIKKKRKTTNTQTIKIRNVPGTKLLQRSAHD